MCTETNANLEIMGGIMVSNDEKDDYDPEECLYDMFGDNNMVYYLFNDEF